MLLSGDFPLVVVIICQHSLLLGFCSILDFDLGLMVHLLGRYEMSLESSCHPVVKGGSFGYSKGFALSVGHYLMMFLEVLEITWGLNRGNRSEEESTRKLYVVPSLFFCDSACSHQEVRLSPGGGDPRL